jgi:RNA-binding protein
MSKTKEKEHRFTEALSSRQRQELKSQAHHLKPVVQVGSEGLSPAVVKEIALALDKHELVKIQLPSQTQAAEKDESESLLMTLLPPHSHIVTRIGRTVIIYCEKHVAEAKIKLKDL